MRATAALEVTNLNGASRCTVLRSAPPLTFRETPAGVHWVGSAAGPVGGDELALDVDVGPGAELALSTVAATLVHPGPRGAPSRMTVSVQVADDAALRWEPRPTVLVHGCDHEADTTIDLHARAGLVWREEVVLGRHAEASGSLRQRLAVDRDGRPLLRTELAVGPRHPASLGPAGTNGARAVGSLLVVGLPFGPSPSLDGVRLAVQALAPNAVLVTAVAETATALTNALSAYSGPFTQSSQTSDTPETLGCESFGDSWGSTAPSGTTPHLRVPDQQETVI